MSALASIVFALAGIHIGAHQVLPVGHSPAWSANAERIAYITRGNLWVADADGTHQALLERGADNPVWAPNGRRLAFSRNGWIWTVRADGNDERRLTRGNHPAWSPHGEQIAYDDDGYVFSVRWFGGQRHKLATGTEPAYAPDGEMAFVRDGSVIVEGRAVAQSDQPTWAPDSKRLAYVHNGTIYVAGRALTRDTQPDWRPADRVRQLLVVSGVGELAAPGRLETAGTLDRGRVDQHEIVIEARTVACEHRDQRFDRVAQPLATLEVTGPLRQDGKQMRELFPSGLEEPRIGRDPHHRLGNTEGDDLRIGQHPSGVLHAPGQEIVSSAEHRNQQQVEVGEHRGPLGSTARTGTADFDLTATGPYPEATTSAVEQLI